MKSYLIKKNRNDPSQTNINLHKDSVRTAQKIHSVSVIKNQPVKAVQLFNRCSDVFGAHVSVKRHSTRPLELYAIQITKKKGGGTECTYNAIQIRVRATIVAVEK